MIKLTVVIPTFNRAELLKKSIQSVLNQTYQDFKLIILDNNSNDKTEEIVKEFSDKRIHYVKNEINIGVFPNMNKAFELSDSEYLIIFHDDDIMKPEFLRKETEILDKYDDVVAVASNVEMMDDDEKFLSEKNFSITQNLFFEKYQFIETYFKSGLYLPCPTVMFRMSFIKENNLRFRELVGACADLYFWEEINTYDIKLCLLKEPLIKYRVHTKKKMQELPNFGKNYRNQILLDKYSYDLADKNNLVGILELIIKNKNYYLNLLIKDVLYKGLSKTDFKEEIKREPFLKKRIGTLLKMKIIFTTFFPCLLKTYIGFINLFKKGILLVVKIFKALINLSRRSQKAS